MFHDIKVQDSTLKSGTAPTDLLERKISFRFSRHPMDRIIGSYYH